MGRWPQPSSHRVLRLCSLASSSWALTTLHFPATHTATHIRPSFTITCPSQGAASHTPPLRVKLLENDHTMCSHVIHGCIGTRAAYWQIHTEATWAAELHMSTLRSLQSAHTSPLPGAQPCVLRQCCQGSAFNSQRSPSLSEQKIQHVPAELTH